MQPIELWIIIDAEFNCDFIMYILSIAFFV